MRDFLPTRFEKIVGAVCIVLILLAPVLAVRNIPNYHVADVSKFGEWSLTWSQDPGAMYGQGPYVNYPMLGLFFSAGLLSSLYTNFEYTEIPDIHNDYRLVLALFDGLCGLCVGLLFALFGLRHAFVHALLLTILPSSWIVTVFGQIDNATQFFILGAFAGLFAALRLHAAGRSGPALLAYGLGAGLALNGLLVKQLFAVSLPALGLAWIFSTLALLRTGFSRRGLVAVNLAAVAIFIYPDFVIDRPDGSLSHVLWIYLGDASDHGKRMASNGFNLWLLWDRAGWDDSSDIPWLFGLAPRRWGLLGWGLSVSLALFFFYRNTGGLTETKGGAGKALSLSNPPRARRYFTHLLILNGVVNLSFNVFMTGTHARHLHHCFPSLLIGLTFFFFSKDTGRAFFLTAGAAVIAAALYYATLVYSQMSDFTGPFLLHPAPRALYFALLTGLLFLFWSRRTPFQHHFGDSKMNFPPGRVSRGAKDIRSEPRNGERSVH